MIQLKSRTAIKVSNNDKKLKILGATYSFLSSSFIIFFLCNENYQICLKNLVWRLKNPFVII